METKKEQIMSDEYGQMAAAINQAINGTIDLGFGIFDRYNQHKEQERNQANVAWTQNFAKDQFEYMKTENQLMREREDNSMQRRVADLKAAGLNPLTVLGATGAMAQLGQTSGQNPPPGVPGRSVPAMAANLDIVKAMKEAELLGAQTDLTKAEADKARSEVGVGRSNVQLGWSQLEWDKSKTQIENQFRTMEQAQTALFNSGTLQHYVRMDANSLRNIRNSENFTRLNNEVMVAANAIRVKQLEETRSHNIATEEIQRTKNLIDREANRIYLSLTEAQIQHMKDEVGWRTDDRIKDYIVGILYAASSFLGRFLGK